MQHLAGVQLLHIITSMWYNHYITCSYISHHTGITFTSFTFFTKENAGIQIIRGNFIA